MIVLYAMYQGQHVPSVDMLAVSSSGGTLHQAAMTGNVPLVRQLLRIGADVRSASTIKMPPPSSFLCPPASPFFSPTSQTRTVTRPSNWPAAGGT